MQADDEAYDRLTAEFGDTVRRSPEDEAAGSDGWVEVDPAKLFDVLAFLRDTPGLEYAYLNDLTVVDFLPIDKKLAAQVGAERFELVYHLSSFNRGRCLTVKAALPRPAANATAQIASVAALWKTAEWHECEAYDLFGVEFVGHPNLRRLLCPEDWIGHPLRKDYEQPLEYHGIRGR